MAPVPTTLGALSDVQAAPQTGDTLVYNVLSTRWESGKPIGYIQRGTDFPSFYVNNSVCYRTDIGEQFWYRDNYIGTRSFWVGETFRVEFRQIGGAATSGVEFGLANADISGYSNQRGFETPHNLMYIGSQWRDSFFSSGTGIGRVYSGGTLVDDPPIVPRGNRTVQSERFVVPSGTITFGIVPPSNWSAVSVSLLFARCFEVA